MEAEFINGQDIANQFSNKMCKSVVEKLKNLYNKSDYKKVDFESIGMATRGMGNGNVIYYLSIPFIAFGPICEANTSFNPIGGVESYTRIGKKDNRIIKGHYERASTGY